MTEFIVWAPDATRVRLRLWDQPDREMVPGEGGWWRVTAPNTRPGTDYSFLLDDEELPLPDPRSRRRPHGVHGPGPVADHNAFAWTDHSWIGRPVPGSVLYELHVGTFTPEGTFDAVIDRLEHLSDLGVDLIELLPVNAVGGVHNGGSNDLVWYAPDQTYGGADGLKRLVNAAHARGLGVIIDVVHHDFGSPGAYAPLFGAYPSGRTNAGGRSVNADAGPYPDEVRRHIVDSALMWLREYHLDGLRLDAGYAIVGHSATLLLAELAAEMDALATHLGRPLSLIVESDLSGPRLISPSEAGGSGRRAQRHGDLHPSYPPPDGGHQGGHYPGFGPLTYLSDVLTGAFAHAGGWSGRRDRPLERHRAAGHRLMAYRQDHDEIHSRTLGDPGYAALSPGLLRVGAMMLMTAAVTPVVFMGEEWGATTPWRFCTSRRERELAAAVVGVNGRRRDFAGRGWPVGNSPDPRDPVTVASSGLDWAELGKPEHRETLEFYRRLIALRKSRPDLSDPALDRVDVRYGDQFVVVARGGCIAAANLAAKSQRITVPAVVRAVLLATGGGVTVMRDGVELPAESAVVVAVPATLSR
jgi:maltooligosyltrehalose trehalohydrolase